MISLQWQDAVLSLLDQAAYPQQEHWITCSTVEETAQALSSGAILEEKIAAVAGVYGYCLAAMAHQELSRPPSFRRNWTRPGPAPGQPPRLPGSWPPPWILWSTRQKPIPKRGPTDHSAGHRCHL